MSGKEFVTVVKATVKEFGKDDVGNMSAALTYYIFFSLFPLLILAITVTALVTQDRNAAADFIYQNATRMLPGVSDLVRDALQAAFQNRTSAGVFALVGFVTLAFSASGAFDALDKSINRAWKTERLPGFIASKLTSFAMMITLALIMMGSFVLTTALTVSRTITSKAFGTVPGSDVFWQLLNFAGSVAVIWLLFLLMYRFLPRSDVGWHDVWLGALIAAIAWNLLKEIFAYYLGSNFSNYDAVYGTLGTVVALLTWIYISSLIILVGAEFTAETARVRRLRAKTAVAGEAEGTGKKSSPWLPERET